MFFWYLKRQKKKVGLKPKSDSLILTNLQHFWTMFGEDEKQSKEENEIIKKWNSKFMEDKLDKLEKRIDWQE